MKSYFFHPEGKQTGNGPSKVSAESSFVGSSAERTDVDIWTCFLLLLHHPDMQVLSAKASRVQREHLSSPKTVRVYADHLSAHGSRKNDTGRKYQGYHSSENADCLAVSAFSAF